MLIASYFKSNMLQRKLHSSFDSYIVLTVDIDESWEKQFHAICDVITLI